MPPNTPFFIPISVDPTEFARTPARGLMVVTQDNQSGAGEAQLIRITL
ncbi:MAG TPA: hypothetical protein VF469_14910 [Kofleriaceae bacterium]